MIGPLAVLLLGAAAEKPAVVSVHAQTVDRRPAVEVVTTSAPVRVGLARAGTDVVLTLDARLPRDLGPITPIPPLRAIDVRRTAAGVAVRMRLDGEVPYEVRRQGTLLTVLFGAEPPAETPSEPGADVQALYRGLMPAPGAESSAAGDEGSRGPERGHLDEAEGFHFGLLTLRPSVSGLYVDAESALLETAEPLPNRYYEIRPRLAGELPVRTGRLQADYEARMRRGSSFALVEDTTTHIANASLELPLGPSIVARGGGHFARGLLETTEVDPGREYFFRLGRYTRYDVSGGLRVRTGGRLDLDLAGGLYRVDVAEDAGFFDHEIRTASAGVGVEIGPRVRAVLGYGYEEIPGAGTERAEARMQAHAGSISLQGEILPLVTGFVTAGYRDQRNPGAGEGGTRYTGLHASARVLKEFSRSTTLAVTAGHGTSPSGFEGNGFLVARSVLGELNLALPLSFLAHAAAGYHRNDYRVPSAQIGRPRQDRITSWAGGLGRSLTDWAFARADYRYERRESNLDQFDTDSHALSVQVGVRLYRPRVGP
ncbi:MAG TPA: outer membrane beta-barrel protein [Vicinamibacteria bacterium]|nr:outer membrane beta-barrel protein [Vicinamibacteria bacterium]